MCTYLYVIILLVSHLSRDTVPNPVGGYQSFGGKRWLAIFRVDRRHNVRSRHLEGTASWGTKRRGATDGEWYRHNDQILKETGRWCAWEECVGLRRNLLGKLGRPGGRRQENIIQMHPTEMWCNGGGWFYPTQDRVHWRALMNKMKNLLVQ
jgi:hypothetical protein